MEMTDKKQDKKQDIFDRVSSTQSSDKKSQEDIFSKMESSYNPKADLAMKLIGGGAALGGALLAKKGIQAVGRFANLPNKLIQPIDAQFKNWQMQNPELMGTSMEDMPSFIQDKISEITRQSNAQANKLAQKTALAQQNLSRKLVKIGASKEDILNAIKVHEDAKVKFTNQSNVAKKVLSQKLANFDEAVLKTPTAKLANLISSEYNNFASSGYNAYEGYLKAGQDYLEAQGKTFTGRDVKNLLNGVEKTAEAAGVLPKDLKTVVTFNESLDPNAKVTVKQLKGIIRNLKDNDFTGDIAHSLQENEGIFLSKHIPKDVVDFDSVNSEYQVFAKTRNKMVGIGANKGLVDTQKLNTYLGDYLNSKFDSGIDSLMASITREGGMTVPIKGAENLFEELKLLKIKKNALRNAVSNININKAKKDYLIAETMKQEMNNLKPFQQKEQVIREALAKVGTNKAKQNLIISNALKEDIDRLVPWKSTAEQLLSRKSAIQAKFPFRTQGWKGLTKGLFTQVAGRGISKALYRPMVNTAMQVVPIIPEALSYMLDKDYRKKFKEKLTPGQMQILLREFSGEGNII